MKQRLKFIAAGPVLVAALCVVLVAYIGIILRSSTQATSPHYLSTALPLMEQLNEISPDGKSMILTRNLGCVRSTELPMSVNYQILNSSNSSWRIVNKTSSCTCTVPSLEFTEIAPGRNAQIQLRLSPSSEFAKQIRQTVDLTFHDRQGATITAKLVALLKVRPPLMVSRESLDFTIKRPLQEGIDEQGVLVTVTNHSTFDIATPTVGFSVPSFLAVTSEPVLQTTAIEAEGTCTPRQTWHFRIKPVVSAPLKNGKTLSRIEFQSSSLPSSPAVVEVACTIRGSLRAFPESIQLRRQSPSGPLTGSTFVSITSRDSNVQSTLRTELIGVDGIVSLERRSKDLFQIMIKTNDERGSLEMLPELRVWLDKGINEPPVVVSILF